MNWVIAGARVSKCGHYRYDLTRRWDDGALLTFVMLNPSTADSMQDDPTIRRCIGFAKRESFGGIFVVNLCAWRATSPAELDKTIDPFGPENTEALTAAARSTAVGRYPLVCAWGTHGRTRGADYALELFRQHACKLVCLGRTADGSPRHPLYVKADQPFVAYS